MAEVNDNLEYAMFSRKDIDHRYARARDLMGRAGIGVLFLSGEENFQYFVGTSASLALHHSLTRPSIFILPIEGDPIIVTQGRDNLTLGSYISDIRVYSELLSFPHEVVLNQGNRVLIFEHRQKVIVVPSGSFSFGVNTNLEALFLFEQVESYVPQHGHVFRRIVFPHPAIVLSKSDIKHPMKAVFYSPMAPNCP